MYQNLTMAMQSVLGVVKMFMRLVLLKPTDNTDESEKALVGNTILVAQPSPEMIAAELPPTEAEQAQYFNVVYGAGASEHAASKLNKKKALTIDRKQYLECARIRAECCPLFADMHINAIEAEKRLPSLVYPTESCEERWRWSRCSILNPGSVDPQRTERLSVQTGSRPRQMMWSPTPTRHIRMKPAQILGAAEHRMH